MPCDYSKYPKNWKSEIRPAVLLRAENKCECCNVENGSCIFRGIWNGIEVWQNALGELYNGKTGDFMFSYTEYFDIEPLSGNPNQMAIKIVLTIAHLDHDTTNNDMDNLKAMCQRCHLNYDKDLHAQNRKATLKKKRGILELFEQ